MYPWSLGWKPEYPTGEMGLPMYGFVARNGLEYALIRGETEYPWGKKGNWALGADIARATKARNRI